MNPQRIVLPIALLAASILAQPISAGAADRTPATLNGEILNGTWQQVSANCNPSGTSTMSYLVTGQAGAFDATGSFSAKAGPYPGTFVEQGTLTIGPQSVDGTSITPGIVQTWNATLAIKSNAGTVLVTEALTGRGSTGLCLVDPNGTLEQAAWGTSPPVNDFYRATITSDRFKGTFVDNGGLYPQLFAPYPWSSAPNSYFEYLASSQTSSTPLQ